VALPGDRIFQEKKDLYLQLRGDSLYTKRMADHWGVDCVWRDGGWWLKNPYARFYGVVHDPEVVGPEELIDYPVTTIPPHRYFMMGDYRDNSTDSRFFGPVPYDYIYYRVFAVWSLSRGLEELGTISHYDEEHPLVIRKKY
jgi:signal peptidase I